MKNTLQAISALKNHISVNTVSGCYEAFVQLVADVIESIKNNNEADATIAFDFFNELTERADENIDQMLNDCLYWELYNELEEKDFKHLLSGRGLKLYNETIYLMHNPSTPEEIIAYRKRVGLDNTILLVPLLVNAGIVNSYDLVKAVDWIFGLFPAGKLMQEAVEHGLVAKDNSQIAQYTITSKGLKVLQEKDNSFRVELINRFTSQKDFLDRLLDKIGL